MYKEMHFNNEIKGPSLFHLINVIIKLIPIAITFRRDRREWVKKEMLL